MTQGNKSVPTQRAPRRKATTREGRENQLANLAYDLAEQRLLDGTASAMEITYFLKLKSNRTALEEAKLQKESLLLQARVDAIESQQTTEKLYKEALAAMRSYQGETTEDDEDV